jgi:excisionase family DNA binding protein
LYLVSFIICQFLLVSSSFNAFQNLNHQHTVFWASDDRDAKLYGGTMEDRWLSVEEIASYLGIKRDTVYRWINEKQMPAHRMGRLWKFRQEEVDEWVKSGGASE